LAFGQVAALVDRLGQMTRIGRADEDDCDCWLGKTERQRGRSCRPACRKIPGEDLAGDQDGAAFGGALQVERISLMKVGSRKFASDFPAGESRIRTIGTAWRDQRLWFQQPPGSRSRCRLS
jgi:hypothetical protein